MEVSKRPYCAYQTKFVYRVFEFTRILTTLYFMVYLTVDALQSSATYFGSYVVSDGYCNQTEKFVDMFSMSEDRVTLTGRASHVSNLIKSLDPKGIETLVLNLTRSNRPNIGEDINLTAIQTYSDLRRLWIIGYNRQLYNLVFNTMNKSGIQITHLHIDMHLSKSNLFSFFEAHTQLRVLDIRNIFFGTDVLKRIFSTLKQSNLEAISLQNIFNFFNNELPNFTLNLTDVFSSYFKGSLLYLDISRNNIMEITGLFSKAFPRLNFLDISYNSIYSTDKTITNLVDLLLHPSIEVINAEKQEQRDIFHIDSNIKETELGAETNSIKKRSLESAFYTIGDSIPACLNGSSVNEIWTNHTLFCHVIQCLIQAEELQCDLLPPFQKIFSPACCGSVMIPLAPNLRQIKLNVLAAGSSVLNYATLDTTICLYINTLKAIDVSFDNGIISYFDFHPPVIRGLEGLEEIRMTNIYIEQTTAIDLSFFSTFSNLKRLYIGQNNVQMLDDLKICTILPKLEILDISSCKIKFIPENLLENCKNIMHLDISHNQIYYVPGHVRESLDNIQQLHEVYVNIFGNVLDCRCHADFIGTILWIQKTNVHFVNHAQYECFGHDGIEFILRKDIDILKDMCSTKDEIIQLLVAILVICILTFSASIVGYYIQKHRYRLKTWYYKRKLSRKSGANQPGYKFDIYLSYCTEDRHWVECILTYICENMCGFKCCIPNRDFPGTGVYSDFVAQNITQSQNIIVVLSNAALKNSYNNFERQFARNLEIHTFLSTRVFYVVLEDLNNVDCVLESMLKSDVSFKWPILNRRKQVRFFEKLMSKIYASIADHQNRDVQNYNVQNRVV